MNKISIYSATQLNRILSLLIEDKKEKIPKDIWKEINNKTDSRLNMKINGENILPETRKYLSFIFLNYLATEEEKKEYTKIIKNNEEQYQKALDHKYSIKNIFDKKEISKKIDKEYVEERKKLPVKYKERFFEFIFNKIKSLFGK